MSKSALFRWTNYQWLAACAVYLLIVSPFIPIMLIQFFGEWLEKTDFAQGWIRFATRVSDRVAGQWNHLR